MLYTTTVVHVPVQWPPQAQHSQPIKSFYAIANKLPTNWLAITVFHTFQTISVLLQFLALFMLQVN